MAFGTTVREMYCPKCNEAFEEGSRRFCPTDGARLISDEIDMDKQAKGIFADLFTRTLPTGTMDEKLDNTPTFTILEDEPDLLDQRAAPAGQNDPFELDIPILAPSESRSSANPPGRKVSPYEIPKGHVDLRDSDRVVSVFDVYNAEDPESFVGRTVKGRYQVVEYLGGDETGVAYLADDRIGDRKVLVRILLQDESDPMMSSILAEERVSLSHFSHPNIARLIDSGAFTNGIGFLVTEYADALSVRDILTIHGFFPPQRAAKILKQAAYALGEAHQEGIIHRDLRPENFILTNEGESEQLKLVNFGASNGEPNERNARYKAPEVLDGRTTTAASDIYSLGVIAFEMITGSLPFEGESVKEYIRSQLNGPAAWPSQREPHLSSAVDDVLEKALSFKAAGRYAKARDLGDAIFAALNEYSGIPIDEPAGEDPGQITPEQKQAVNEKRVEVIRPIPTASPSPAAAEPAWKNRSPEPPQEETSRAKIIAAIAIAALLALLVFGWYYIVNHPAEPALQQNANISANGQSITPTIASDIEMPPQPRKITQPPNSEYYANSKQNLRGDLLRNFVGFSLYYPKEWKLNGPQEATAAGARGQFLDISRSTPEGKLKEQMLVSYYPSKGTYNADAASFAQLVKESNETLKRILPGYQMVSEGEIKVNGDWRAYEVKFQGSGVSETGERLTVWGRRLFMPAARPGVRNGFMITMLATSLAEDVKSVDDVGVHGELAPILYSFEPSQNF